MRMANTLPLLVIVATLLWAAPAQAKDPVNSTFFKGTAIHGYDPVAYFHEGKPMEGSGEYTAEYNGAAWRFVNAVHRDMFKAEPEKYAPQYGGYCAWAVAEGYTADIDPEAWTIHEGKLYLNYSLKVREQWDKDREGNIARADANWPGVLD